MDLAQPRVEAKSLRIVLALVFTLSGFSTLAYQVAWQRALTQVIGADSISVTLIVTIFMICLGAGAQVSRRLVQSAAPQAVLAYALIEIFVGIYGCFSIPLMRATNGLFAELGIEALLSDALLNMALLAPAVVGMGMTAPLIVHVTKHSLDAVGRTIGLYYGLNIFGAALGTLVTGLVLIEALGLRGTTWLAAFINVAIGLVMLRYRPAGNLRTVDRTNRKDRGKLRLSFGLAAVLFGFGTLGLQMVFFRVLSNYFTLSAIVFPVVLCAYLLLMAAGQSVGGRLADRYADRLPVVLCGLFACGSLALSAALAFPPSAAVTVGALRFTSFSGALVAYRHPGLVEEPFLAVVLLFSALFMAAVLPWSALFPVMTRHATWRVEDVGDRFAYVYVLYTSGNVLGAFLCGILLLGELGTALTAMVLIVLVGLGAVALVGRGRPSHRAALGFVSLGLAAIAMIPRNYYHGFSLDDYQVADVIEGRIGVASVVPTSRFYTIIDMNRTASASAIAREPGHGDQYEAWRWNHSELFALDPSFRPRRVLVIGIGHAYLVDALLDFDFIEQVVVVDLAPEVVEAVRANTLTGTSRVFNDPRVQVLIGDGRRYVQKALARGDRFDLIQNKINEPWHAGAGNLFTVEFFEMQRRLLTAGGYLGVRPLLGHLADGLEVFPVAIFPGYYHLYFKNGSLPLPTKARVSHELHGSWTATLPGARGEQGSREHVLTIAYLTSGHKLGEISHNRDDRPTFEYYWLRQRLGRWDDPRRHLLEGVQPESVYQIPIVIDES